MSQSTTSLIDSLNRKMCRLGITFTNIKERTKELHAVRVDRFTDEMHLWCDDTCYNNWIWSTPLQTDYTDLFFLKSADALMFALRFLTVAA